MNKQSKILAGVAALLATGVAEAGEFNNKALLTGEKAAGLGGAYVALADEQTGMFYNPAGIVHAPVLGATATVNLLTVSSTTYDDVFGDTEWTRESLELVPGFFGSMVRDGKSTYGFAIVVVDSASEDQTEQFSDVQVGTMNWDELRIHNNFNARRYNIGASLGRELGDGWSLGGSLFIDYYDRDRSYIQRLSEDADPSTVQDDQAILVQVERENTSIGVRPVLGVMYRGQRWSLGASIAKSLPLSRDYYYAYTAAVNNAANPADNVTFDLIDETDESESQPLELAVAAAYVSSTNTTWTLQLDYTAEREVDAPTALGGAVPPRDLSTEAVLNVAAGVERPLSSSWLMRAGAYTNFANNKADEAAAFERREEIDLYGLTFSLTKVDAEKLRHWTVGAQIEAGSGDATLGDVGFGATAGQQVDASSYKYNLFISVNM